MTSSAANGAALRLRGVDGQHHTLSELAGRTATVLIFIGNGCPTVRAYEDRLMRLRDGLGSEGIAVVAVNSNNPSLSPPDTMAEMTKRARMRGFNFSYLKDTNGALAKSFGAICTPHAFLLDGELRTVYSGRIDDSRLGDRISSRDLENAIADVLVGRPIAVPQTEPFGCSIVW